MASAIIISILSTLTPYLLKIIVDDYILLKNYDGMLTLIMIMVGVLFLEVIFMYLFTFYANWLGQKVIKDLRVSIFQKIIKFKMSFFDNNAVGRLVTRTVNDIETIASIFSQGLFTIIADILKMLTVLIVMLVISWELTLVVISIFPLLIYATRVFQKTMKVAFEKVRTEVANLNSFVQERISGIKIVQIFSRESLEIKNFQEINSRHKDAWLKTVWINSIFFPIAEISTSICIGLLVWYGGFNNIQGDNISLGTLFLFISMSGLLFRPLRQIADRFNTLQMGMVSTERIFKILEDDSIIQDKGFISMDNINGMIEFKNVTFSYVKNEKVIDDISFKVNSGETLAIVGPTGSGKTTITNLITRFYEYDKGEILIDGVDINDLNFDLDSRYNNNVRCPVPIIAKQMEQLIQSCKLEGDTVGGQISTIISGVPVGLGEPVFNKLGSALAQSIMSINSCKGIDFGLGFLYSKTKGSDVNDQFFNTKKDKIKTVTNNSGGMLGGISNGEDIFFRTVYKPVSTIFKNQHSVNDLGENIQFTASGRHDPCVVPRVVPIIDSLTAITILDYYLLNKTTKISDL